MKQFGDMKEVTQSYAEFVNQYKNLTKDEQIEYKDKMVGIQMEESQHLDLPKEKNKHEQCRNRHSIVCL